MFFKINGYKVIKKNKKNPTKMRSYFSIIQIKLRTAYMLKLNTEDRWGKESDGYEW